MTLFKLCQNYQAKSLDFTLFLCGNRVILTSVVLSQYRGLHASQTDRQTTSYDNSRTLQCRLQRSANTTSNSLTLARTMCISCSANRRPVHDNTTARMIVSRVYTVWTADSADAVVCFSICTSDYRNVCSNKLHCNTSCCNHRHHKY